MNRIISLSVEDMYIKYTGEAFGATGSHNAVTLRMTFGPAWDGTAKTAYFTDALGDTSVALVLGLDTLVDGAYEVDVPSEALKTAGVATITIKGVLISGETTTKAITTAAGHFRVLDSELPDSAGNAGTITPSDKEQLQAEIAGMETLFTTAKAAAETAAANAKVSETNAKASETAAASSVSAAEGSKTAAAESAATATAQANAASESAAKAAASQKAAQTAETNAKASEKAAAASQGSAETASASAQDSAAAAAQSAQTAQGAASMASNAASFASQSATAASGSASQSSAAATAAAQSAASVDGINKTAQSWAVGGTGTREGEDTNNAKYWAEQAQAVVGGDFATKNEARGYVMAHNKDTSAHADIREAIANKAETFVVTISDLKTDSDGYWDSGITDHTAAEIIQAANAGKIVIAKVIQLVSSVSGVTATTYLSLTVSYYKTDSSMVLCCAITDYVSIITAVISGNTVSFRQGRIGTLETSSVPLASGIAAVGTSDNCARADHVHPQEVSDTDRAAWDGKAAGTHARQHGANGSDPLTPDAIGAIASTAKGTVGGVASLGADGKVPASQLPEISSVKTYTATIGTTWTEDSNTGVKTQSVAIAGVKATNTATVDHVYTGSGTSDDYAAFVEAENQYLNCIANGYAETYNGGIKFTIFGDANTVAIPIVAEVS